MSKKGNNGGIRALSYYLLLFPSIDVCSAYPLVIHTIANNIYTVAFCRDTTKKSKHPKLDYCLYLIIKLFSALLPIVAALFISNLVVVLKYAGLMGFFISLLFPTALQIRSIWVCNKEFETLKLQSGNTGTNSGNRIIPCLEDEVGKYLEGLDTTENKQQHSLPVTRTHRLLQMFDSYRTPYSNRVLSHPVTVCVIGGLEVLLFLLAISSLAVHPSPLHCNDDS